VQIDHLALSHFKPGDITEILIRIDIANINQMSINVSIVGKNEITEEEVIFQALEIFGIYDALFEDLFIGFFMAMIIGIFVIVWAVMFIYIRRTKKKIETPFEEPTKVKPRRGKYVSVTELPPKETEEIIEEIPTKKPKKPKIKKLKKPKIKKPKKPKVEEKEKPTTDLDSLLEEKGLKDKE
jgi:hypothetical protein